MHSFTSTTADGNMSYTYGTKEEVDKNRSAFFMRCDIDPERVIVMSCEHVEKIVRVGMQPPKTPLSKVLGSPLKHEAQPNILFEMFSGTSAPISCEAFITNEKNLALFLLTADCYPVVYYDPLHEVVGLAHLGWKPTSLHLAQKVVERMQIEFGTRAEEIEAHFGPGISANSYITPTPTAEQMRDRLWQPFIRPHESRTDMYHVDLLGFNKARLESAGVLPYNIHVAGVDTATDSHFFSHYRAALRGEVEGRFATVVVL